MSFIQELKRRNVFRVGIAYAVAAWILLQLTDVLVDLLGLPEVAGKYVVLLLVIGFIPALIFAWAFEMTPEGLKREKDVDRSQSITDKTGHKLDRAIIGVLVIALGYFVVDKFWLTPARQDEAATQLAETTNPAEKTPETIAVLPFVDMSPDGDNEYFSDGLTEELLNILAKIKDLQVAGRTSSFAFKGQNEDLRGIGEKLGVKTILEGSVRKDEAGNRVRITAQLVNVENGFHLWSETYDRELKDIFAIQDEIAHEVAAALKITLFGEDKARLASRATTELNAYELYLRGLKNLREFSYASLDQAVIDFEHAIELDPGYIPAQLGLASTLLGQAGTGSAKQFEAISRAEPLLNSILENDPENSTAHVAMAWILSFQGDMSGRREALERALEADPRNVAALTSMGSFVFSTRSIATGMEYLKEAERIDPYSTQVLGQLCLLNAFILEVETAEAYCARIGEVSPDNPMQFSGQAFVNEFNGELALAIFNYRESIKLDPDDYEIPSIIALNWVSLGDLEQAEAWLEKAEENGQGQPYPLMARMEILLSREQFGMAADLAKRALERKLDNRLGTQHRFEDIWFASLVQQGKMRDGIVYLQEKHPGFFESPPDYDMDYPLNAEDLFQAAYLMKLEGGNPKRADEMLEAAEVKWAIRDEKVLPWRTHINRARVASMRGDKDAAIEHLYSAFETNHRSQWRLNLLGRMSFLPLHDEPEFKRLVAMYEADMDRQREEAYELLGIAR